MQEDEHPHLPTAKVQLNQLLHLDLDLGGAFNSAPPSFLSPPASKFTLPSQHNTNNTFSLTLTPLLSSQIGKPLPSPFTLCIYISLTRHLPLPSLSLSTGNGSHTLRVQVRYLAFSSHRSKHSLGFFHFPRKITIPNLAVTMSVD